MRPALVRTGRVHQAESDSTDYASHLTQGKEHCEKSRWSPLALVSGLVCVSPWTHQRVWGLLCGLSSSVGSNLARGISFHSVHYECCYLKGFIYFFFDKFV